MSNLLSELDAVLTQWDDMGKAYDFLRTHHAEIAAAVRDAARYRWLLEHAGSIRTDCWHWQSHSAASVEKLIGAAMSAREGQ